MQFTEPGLHHMRLAKTARTFSFVALFTALFQTIFLPYIFGGLAIIFAAISKGNNAHYQLNAKIAILLSILTLIFNSAFIGLSVYLVTSNDYFKSQLNTTYEQIYGMTFDEYMEQFSGGYQIDSD